MATQDGRADIDTLRRELVRRRLAERDLAESPAAVEVRPDRSPTAGQRRMWSLQQLDPLSVGYNVRIAVDLTGPLDPGAMAAAVRSVVARHDVLRTTYRMGEDGEVVQVGHADLPPVLDVRALPAAEVDGACRDLAGRPFDLAVDSPLRVGVFTTGPDTATLVVVAHHIAWDDATSAIFFGELMAHYARPDVTPPPARQIADLVLPRASSPDFWRDALAAPPEPLELPWPRAATSGVDQQRALRPGAAARVRELARADGASTFMVLLAAVTALLHRYTGSRDLVVGAPVVNRDLPGGDEVVGYLGNTIPLRMRVEDGDTFTDLLARAKRVCLAAYAHQDVDLDDVTRAVDPGRTRGDAGLFDVVLSLRTPVLDSFRQAGFTAARRHVPGPDARFALTLAVETDGDDLTAEANHPDAPHAVELVARLLGHLDLVLDRASAEPGTPVEALPVLTDDERARLAGWNDTAARVPEPLLPELFARQVAATPDARALLTATGEVTYRELDRRAAALARLLVAEGAGPDTVVALAVPRSVELVVAVLAVVKAGAAYVPVDPGYPADRVRLMLTDARPTLLLTTPDTRLPATPGLPTVLLGAPETAERLAAVPPGDPEVLLRPGHPAYVIYTSGSTGVPKGVVVSHGALRNHLAWSVRRFAGLAGHTLLHSSVSFDFTVTPLFGPLITGGCLELCADSPDSIADALGAATFLKITPSHLPLLPSVRFAADGPRTLVIAGEALRGEALEGWLVPAGLDVINEYGPTETTVGCLLHPVESTAGVVAPGPVPVGSPVDNVTCHVLDDRLRPVPVGVEGELYVGGAQDARGYLDRPGLTASRFVADPFGSGGRLYRTGDRVRRLPTGALEFRGRVDDQVKIRGFRVEPGEVEAVLLTHPGVERAVVVARTDGPGGAYLAAYVIGTAAPADLRAHVAAVLPEHLVPAAVVPVSEIPLSPSGKLDRRALPAPDFAAPSVDAEPAGEVARVLAGLFAEVLNRPSVGVGDSFFELGGDSIVAIRLVGRARKAGLRITPRDVFAHRTPAKLAELPGVRPDNGVASRLAALFAEVLNRPSVGVGDSFFELGGDSIVAIRLVGRARKAGLRITPRDVFTHRTPAKLAEVAAVQEAVAPAADGVGAVELTPIMRSFAERGPLGDRHRMSLRLKGPEPLDEARLLVALQAVLDRHDALRARLDRDGPALEFRPVGSVRAADVLRAAESTVDERAVADRLVPADGTVVQVVWFPGTAELLVVVHHLVVDGVSWRVFVEDLATAYRGEALAPVPTSFRAWASGLRARAADRVAELPTWRSVLAGPDPVFDQPGERTWADVRTVTVRLDPETTGAVLTTVPALFFAGVDDVLLTALALAVGSWNPAARSFPVLLEGHGRQEAAVPGADLSRTIGWFTSQHPVRLDTTGVDLAEALAGGPAAGVLVKRVKEHLRSLPDHGIGFGVLRHLHGAGELASPAPRLGFNYLGRFDAAGDQGWTVPADGLSAAYDPTMPLFAGLVANAVTEDTPDGPSLVAHWMYAEGAFDAAGVADLADLWCAALRALVKHASGGGTGGRTPSDVALISLNQGQLDALEAKWKRA
ncbi:amino acid adenylation domain-containing protein [Actinosynnema sp. NPDC020468]|uniref:amino acid adenylation domain-containing protein n=1 Tax=Actinosynnema sp. NPDC020468 TaxID=3154488 RepID=UPI0033D62475